MIIGICNGRRIVASKKLKRQDYFCPICGEPVVLRAGKVKMAHFAHCKNTNCASSEGETQEHLLGKKQLYHWTAKKGLRPRYEVYLSEIQQRPDILLSKEDGTQIALEFQCSPLSIERLMQRNQGYKQLHIQVWWILGAPYLKRKLSATKRAQFMQLVHGQLVILYWSTADNRFVVWQPLENLTWNVSEARLNNVQLISQTRALQQQVMRADAQIQEIQQRCYLQRHSVVEIPLVCHAWNKAILPLKVSPIIWRTTLLLKLECYQIGEQWHVQEWLELLVAESEEQWLQFACLTPEQEEKLRLSLSRTYTRRLLEARIIRYHQGIVTFCRRAEWFTSYEQKINYLSRCTKKSNH